MNKGWLKRLAYFLRGPERRRHPAEVEFHAANDTLRRCIKDADAVLMTYEKDDTQPRVKMVDQK